ncbi:MAG TPA: DMT family transporter [Coleofasciculaceae cyanobacterium]
MEPLDQQPNSSDAGNPQTAEALLQLMAQDIENLRQNLLSQLSHDIERLQKEKEQLIEDIEQLQSQRQQQLAQQQQLVRQIAPALINQLQAILKQRLKEQQLKSDATGLPTPTANDYNENAYRLIASLDSTLRTTFRTLQQDLSSYQSSLSQQLAQMYSLEQQGEAILEALVSRLREEIPAEPSRTTPTLAPSTVPQPPSLPQHEAYGYSDDNHNGSLVPYSPQPGVLTETLRPEPEPLADGPPLSPPSQQNSKRWLGFIVICLSLLAMSCEYVVVHVMFNQSPIFRQFELGGFVAPTIGNSLLILWLRMLVVVPLMALVATRLYSPMWQDLGQFVQSKDWSLFFTVLSSGFLLSVSHVLLYRALGSIAPGNAVTIFFIYPVVTVLLSWLLFGNRLLGSSLIRNLIISVILVGFIVITLGSSSISELSRVSVSSATGSAIAFGLYIILTQTYGKAFNPIPLSWINCVVILAVSSLSLLAGLLGPKSWGLNLEPSIPWLSLVIGSLALGGTTFVSYLCNTIGVRAIGAAQASILGAIVPVLTAIVAWVVIKSPMPGQQIFGLILVTSGVTAFNFERWYSQVKAAQSGSRTSH